MYLVEKVKLLARPRIILVTYGLVDSTICMGFGGWEPCVGEYPFMLMSALSLFDVVPKVT